MQLLLSNGLEMMGKAAKVQEYEEMLIKKRLLTIIF